MHDSLVEARERGDFDSRLMALKKGDGLWLDQLTGDFQGVGIM